MAIQIPSTYNIRENTISKLNKVGHNSRRIKKRLTELDNEWDVERVLETQASSLMLTGLALGVTVNKKWFLLSAAVGGFLLQHAVQGWCPPLPILRRLGVRTRQEIENERMILKARLGEIHSLNKDPRTALGELEH